MAVLSLRDEGRLDIDAPLGDVAPDLQALGEAGPDAPPVTVRQLLTMDAGLPQDDPWADRLMAEDKRLGHGEPVRARRDALARARHRLRVLELRLGGARARRRDRHRPALPGRRARARARAARAEPPRSGAPATCPAKQVATGYRPAGDGFTAEVPLADGGDFAALGGLYSSVRDLARWSGVFLDAEPPRDAPERAPVSRATLREMSRARSAFAPGVEWPSLAEPPGVVAGGYGYGLMIWHERDGQRHVGHPGGLPGYGTLMRWVPELGLSVILLANVTYAKCERRCAARSSWSRARPRCRAASPGPTRPAGRARGGRRPRRALGRRRGRPLFTPNVDLDRPLAERRAELAELGERHGALARDGEIEPEDALRGSWRLRGERGHVDLAITMAPTVPPLVQTLEVESVLPPAGLLATLATAAAGLASEPARRAGALGALLSPPASTPRQRRCAAAGRGAALRPVRRARAGRGRRRDDRHAAPAERPRGAVDEGASTPSATTRSQPRVACSPRRALEHAVGRARQRARERFDRNERNRGRRAGRPGQAASRPIRSGRPRARIRPGDRENRPLAGDRQNRGLTTSVSRATACATNCMPTDDGPRAAQMRSVQTQLAGRPHRVVRRLPGPTLATRARVFRGGIS